MDITLNNKPQHFQEEILSVQEIIDQMNFSFKMLVVKLNGSVIKKTDYDSVTVKDGDNLAIIHLISGG